MFYGQAQENSVRKHKYVIKALKDLKGAWGGLLKLAKWLAIEFGVMTLALGAVELAFYAAQLAARAWNFTLNALGAAAGVAIGGLTGVMAALRQVQAVRMQPLFGPQRMGGKGAASQMNMLLGDPRLGMFDDASLMASIESARRAGMEVDVRLRQTMERLGNFALIGTGDPSKNLSTLVYAFGEINKEGKVTRDVFDEIAKASPEMARAIGTLAGSKATDPKHMLKAAQDAADAGKISAKQFTDALNSGELGKQYADVLDQVNQTLVGRFKSQWRRMKQALVEVGNPIVDIFNDGENNPIEDFGNRLRFSLYQMSPVITREFKKLNKKLFGDASVGLFDNIIDRAVRRISSGLPRLIGWGEGLMRVLRGIRSFFQDITPWFERASRNWDKLYAGFVRPIGTEIFNTIKYAIEEFGSAMASMDSAGFAQAIGVVGESVRQLIDQFNNIRKALSPIVEGLLRFFGVLFDNPVSAFVAVALALGAAFLKIQLAAMRIGPAFRKASLEMQKGLQGVSNAEHQVEAAMIRKNIKAEAQKRLMEQTALSTALTTKELRRLRTAETSYATANPGAMGPAPKQRWWNSNRMGKMYGGLMAGGLLAEISGLYIQGKASPTDKLMQPVGAALSGAGMGVMIGGMAGPIGAAVGAAVGGLTGATLGLIRSTDALREQREKELAERTAAVQKEATVAIANATKLSPDDPRTQMAAFERLRAGARAYAGADSRFRRFRQYHNQGSLAGRLLNPITAALPGTDGKTKDNMYLTPSELAEYKIIKKNKEQLDAYNKAIAEQTQPMANLTSNFNIMSETLGMSGDEIAAWVETTGYQMKELRMSAEDLFTKVLGYTDDMVANLATASGRLRDALQLSITQTIKAIDTRIAADEAWQNVKYAGPMDRDKALKTALEFMNTRTDYVAGQFAAGRYRGKGGATKMIEEFFSPAAMERTISQIADPGMRAAMREAFRLIMPSVNQIVSPENIMKYDPAVAGAVKDRLNGFRTGVSPFAPGINDDEKNKILRGDTNAARTVGNRALAAINSGTGAFAGIRNPDVLRVLRGLDPVAIGQMMANQLYDPTNPNNLTMQVSAAGPILAQHISDAVKEALNSSDWNMPTFRATLSGDTLTFTPIGDTSSPRGGAYGDTASRWARTFGKHARYNRSIPGSRSITSGVRNFALGSPSSDHRFGRAYDLTGDNLGMYAGQVRSDGGFAEFHGRGTSRHLHVVPSPASGDTAVPASIGVRAGGGGSSMTQTVSFNIVAGPNASPDEIARAVMVKLRQAERSAQERV